MKIKFLLLFLFINGIAYSKSLDSLFNDLKRNVKFESQYSTTVLVNNFDLKTLKYDLNISRNKSLTYKLYFQDNEIKKVDVLENEKLSFEFWLYRLNEFNVFIRRDFTFFLIDRNQDEDFEYLFFQFEKYSGDLNNDFKLENLSKIISVSKEFKPLTMLYLNKTNPIAASNFIYKNDTVFEEIYIYYQDSTRCFSLTNKVLKFLFKYFRIKGDLVCDVFKNYQIKIFDNHYHFLWYLGNYQQEYETLINSKFKNTKLEK
jgi:hypothetical protein